MTLVETRFKAIAFTHLLRRLAIHSALCGKGSTKSCNITRAIYDSLLLGFLAREKLGALSLYRAPYVRSGFKELKCFTLGACEELKIVHRDVVYSKTKA
jgi:hypothetical protein